MRTHRQQGVSKRSGRRTATSAPKSEELLFAIVASPLMFAMFVPPDLILPLVCLLSLTIAGVVALIARWAACDEDGSNVNLWDVSGACVLVGVAAGILGDAESILELSQTEPQRSKP